MGIIKTQSIKNSLSLYIGVVIGAINTILVFPFVFEENPEFWGLLQILVSYSIVSASFSHLGAPSVIIKYFPTLEKKERLFTFSFLMCLLGFFIFTVLFIIFKDVLLLKLASEALLVKNFSYVLILVLFISFFNLLNCLSSSYLDSVSPMFLNEVFLRVYTLVLLSFYHYEFINFEVFLRLYILGFFIKLLLLSVLLFIKKRLCFSFDFSGLAMKEYLTYALYVITGGGAAALVSKFDMLMIEYYLDLEQVAYYGLAFFIASVIKVPARSLAAISSPLLAKSLKENNISMVKQIYSKSSINLLIVGGLLFLGIWLNIDDILSILPQKFSQGKYVVLFIGLAQLVNLAGGQNGFVLVNSKYYRSIIVFNLILFAIIFVTNILFIPKYGINGAALASVISLLIFNLLRILYIHKKLKVQPFTVKTILCFLLIIGLFLVFNMMSFSQDIFINIGLKSILVTIVYVVLVKKMKLSEDMVTLIDKYILFK